MMSAKMGKQSVQQAQKLEQSIGFIGNGMMAEAIVVGLLNSKTAVKEQIFSSNP